MNRPERRASDADNSTDWEYRNSHWRVLKDISIPTLLALLVQTGTGIWWAASMSAKVDSLEKTLLQNQVAQSAVDSRQDGENSRNEGRLLSQLERVNAKLDRIVEQGNNR